MGFMTRGKPTEKVTYLEREEVTDWVDKFAEEQGWDLSDVRNRAIMYYATQYKKGKLEDPRVDRTEDAGDIGDLL